MATAKQIQQPELPFVTLELNKNEAHLLIDLLGMVAGSGKNRHIVEEIAESLLDATGLNYRQHSRDPQQARAYPFKEGHSSIYVKEEL